MSLRSTIYHLAPQNKTVCGGRPAGLSMAVAGPGDASKVVVCGPRDGIAGLVVSRLSGAGGARQVMLADETETLEQQVGVACDM